MKELSDGTQITARMYYYLLDFNEWNEWKYLRDNFGKKRLHDLNKTEFLMLFKYATESDYKTI